ncbi:MAG: tRNA pseudouridine(38-40) synthase TruA [Firmicutes bacterium]|nr:tRNA pseudouridine(38-40) synthase TruA [Bacillota bacterium]
MRNIKLTIQYDGTMYHGWQMQKNAPTVQEELSRAISRVTGSLPNITGSSRTDAKVHAKHFVCNFKTESSVPCEKLPLALNTYLPDDIVCLSAEDCKSDFNARFSAKKKCYTYYILNSKLPCAFLRNYSWHFPYEIDIENMKKAAKGFIGKHDFAGFAASGGTVKTTVREIYSLDVTKEGDLIKITVTGDGFLYNMVRIIAGTLCFAGCGKIDYLSVPEIIASRDRKRAGITAPPQGLFLTEVYYDE